MVTYFFMCSFKLQSVLFWCAWWYRLYYLTCKTHHCVALLSVNVYDWSASSNDQSQCAIRKLEVRKIITHKARYILYLFTHLNLNYSLPWSGQSSGSEHMCVYVYVYAIICTSATYPITAIAAASIVQHHDVVRDKVWRKATNRYIFLPVYLHHNGDKGNGYWVEAKKNKA